MTFLGHFKVVHSYRYCQYGTPGECQGPVSEVEECKLQDCKPFSTDCSLKTDLISSCAAYKSFGTCKTTSRHFGFMDENCAKTCCTDFDGLCFQKLCQFFLLLLF